MSTFNGSIVSILANEKLSAHIAVYRINGKRVANHRYINPLNSGSLWVEAYFDNFTDVETGLYWVNSPNGLIQKEKVRQASVNTSEGKVIIGFNFQVTLSGDELIPLLKYGDQKRARKDGELLFEIPNLKLIKASFPKKKPSPWLKAKPIELQDWYTPKKAKPSYVF
jgi:hypothetical protein